MYVAFARARYTGCFKIKFPSTNATYSELFRDKIGEKLLRN